MRGEPSGRPMAGVKLGHDRSLLVDLELDIPPQPDYVIVVCPNPTRE